MINAYRPVPGLPPPPPPPPGVAPVAPPKQAAQAFATSYQPAFAPPGPAPVPAPVRHQLVHWDPLGELAFSVVGTPAIAAVGAALGFFVAGPIGAARGALIGAAIPGTLFTGHELIFHNPWTSTPRRMDPLGIAALAAFPLVSAAGYGIGMAVAGAAGAAWGTLIAAALPIAAVFIGSAVNRWLHPPVYDPAPVPTPTAPLKR